MSNTLPNPGDTLIGLAPVTAMPLTLACHVKPINVTSAIGAAQLYNNVFTQYYQLGLAGNLAGDPVRAVQIGSGAAGAASTSSGFSASTWQHACAVFTSTTSRAAYLDGGSKGTDTTSSTAPATITYQFFGTGNPVGDVADGAVWDATLSDADVLMLARGFSPLLVRPASLVAYYPMFGNDIEIVGSRPLNGGVASVKGTDHPRLFTPRRR